MVADPGLYSGESEGHQILAAMKAADAVVNTTTAMPMCAEVIEGRLGVSSVSLVTTGIGHDNSASCMVDVIRHYENINDTLTTIMYMGTSGFTPRIGGFFNPKEDTTCTNLPISTTEQLVGIGDVCVSPLTFIQACGFCNWNGKTEGECSYPECTRHNDTTVFGQCDFGVEDTGFADAVAETARGVKFPGRSGELQEYIDEFWASMWSGMGMRAGLLPATQPKVFDKTRCGEGAGYNLWAGTPEDYQCRLYLADLITKQTGTPTAANEVVCVGAMEGPGWISVLSKKASKTGVAIPYVNIRANSDYSIFPVTRGPNNILLTNTTWTSPERQVNFTKEGYKYAITVGSQIVLSHFGAL